MRALRHVGALTCLFVHAACGWPFPTEPGSPRKDPGTLQVRVLDQNDAAIAGAWVYVELPNGAGGTFQEGTATKANGVGEFRSVPAGRRTVEVKPPAGYRVGSDSPLKQVEVIKDATVSLEFRLLKS